MSRRNPQVEIRVSAFTWVILAICLLEVACAVLALSLPWGPDNAGGDIRFGLEGLLPWFAFVPVMLQAGFLAVNTSVFQALYLVADFLIACFILLVQYLTFVEYNDFRAGFFLVFVAGGLALLGGIVCAVERYAFPRLERAGKARRIPVHFGEPERPA